MELDEFGFLVLCPGLNIGGLRTTISSIKVNFPRSHYICVIGDRARDSDLDEIDRICPVVKGRNSITSLINIGMESAKAEWNCVASAGVMAKYPIYRKLIRFLESERDIFYPVVDKVNWRFENSSLNGFCVHRDTFNDIGRFEEEDHSLELCRLFWAATAVEKGYQFKGLVGLKF